VKGESERKTGKRVRRSGKSESGCRVSGVMGQERIGHKKARKSAKREAK
jgi:hypothetical protein